MRIENVNGGLSFRSYYTQGDKVCSEVQKVVIQRLKNAIESPKTADKKGNTLYQRLSDKGVDVFFCPDKNKKDVGVSLLRGVKKNSNSNVITYDSSRYIDSFDKDNSTKVIKKIEKDTERGKATKYMGFVYAGLFAAIAVGAPIVDKYITGKGEVNPKTEQIIKQSKPVEDSVKVATPWVKKVINKLKP